MNKLDESSVESPTPRIPTREIPTLWTYMTRHITLCLFLTTIATSLLAQDSSPAPLPATKDELTSKIIGGEKSDPGKWPFVAALLYSDESDGLNAQFCAGTLVDPYWVLTAAHCVEGLNPSGIQVAVGVQDLGNIGPENRINVGEIIIHPDYQDVTLAGDAALLLLDRPISNTEIAPLVYDEDQFVPDTISTVVGWGNTSGNSNPEYPYELHEVELPIVSRETANHPDVWDGDLSDSAFAAGYEEGERDTCAGDSGGPLFVYDIELERWLLAGITSASPGDKDCGDAMNYGSYTNVFKIQNWVYDHIHPEFLSWLETNEVNAPFVDSDNDGLKNWEEFFFGTNPHEVDKLNFRATVVRKNSKIYPAIEYTGSAENMAQLFAEASAQLSTWNRIPLSEHTVVTEFANSDGIAMKRAIVRTNTPFNELAAPAQFLRPRAEWTGKRETNGRRLTAGKHLENKLIDIDEEINGSFTRLYRLDFEQPISPLNISLRSQAFDGALSIEDQTGQTLFIDTQNSGGGNDDLITFFPSQNTEYRVRVSTESPGELGKFTLNTFAPLSISNTLEEDQLIESALNASDETDPLYPFTTYYKEDFLLNGINVGDRIRVTLESDAFMPSLSLVFAESGKAIGEQVAFENDSFVEFIHVVNGNDPLIARATTGIDGETGSFDIWYVKEQLATISLGSTVNGSIETSDEIDPLYEDTYYKDDYLLDPLSDGTFVRVRMESNEIDSFLTLLDADSGEVIDSDDDLGGGLDSLIEFTYDSDIRYLIRATTSLIEETGNYTLSVD